MPPPGSQCPTRECKAESPDQVSVDAAALSSAGVNGDWIQSAHKCAACKCVYSVHGANKKLRGYLDSAVLGAGWRAIHI